MATFHNRPKPVLFSVLKRVFSRPSYIVAALLSGVALVSVISLLPHLPVLGQVLTSGLSLVEKLQFVVRVVLSLGGHNSTAGTFVSLVVALLFGVQTALLIFYVRRRIKITQAGVTASVASVGGMVAALFGVGCAACGTIIATTLLGLFGAAGILLWLPLHGLEFSLLGIAVLLLTIRYLVGHINDPLACAIS